MKRGLCSADSVINIALCCLGFLPGLLHAWYIIAKYPETDYDSLPQDGGERGGTVTYYYVSERPSGERPRQQQRGYGTTENLPPPESGVAKTGSHHSNAPVAGPGESSAGGVPPSYDQAVRGDHKIQT